VLKANSEQMLQDSAAMQAQAVDLASTKEKLSAQNLQLQRELESFIEVSDQVRSCLDKKSKVDLIRLKSEDELKALTEMQNKRKQEMQARIRAHQELEIVHYQAILKEEDEVIKSTGSRAKLNTLSSPAPIQRDVVLDNHRRDRLEADAAEKSKSQHRERKKSTSSNRMST